MDVTTILFPSIFLLDVVTRIFPCFTPDFCIFCTFPSSSSSSLVTISYYLERTEWRESKIIIYYWKNKKLHGTEGTGGKKKIDGRLLLVS